MSRGMRASTRARCWSSITWALPQPFDPPAKPAPFADLPKLLELAAHDNVAVKITGACTLSHKPYPYDDLWDPLRRVFDAFGFAIGACGAPTGPARSIC